MITMQFQSEFLLNSFLVESNFATSLSPSHESNCCNNVATSLLG